MSHLKAFLHSFSKETQIFVPRHNEDVEGGYWITLRPSICPSICLESRPYVRVSDPGASGKMDRLKLRFFWERV